MRAFMVELYSDNLVFSVVHTFNLKLCAEVTDICEQHVYNMCFSCQG